MSTEIRLKLRGPAGGISASRVVDDLAALLHVVEELEDAQRPHAARRRAKSDWAISHLRIASVEAGLAPLEARGGATWQDLDDIAERTVTGFEQAEQDSALPTGWTPQAARPAASLGRHLGTTAERGARLDLLIDGKVVKSVEITRRVATNLTDAVKSRRTSIGSVIGVLGSVSVRQRRVAGLWPERGGPRVTVLFDADDQDDIASSLGHRVQVSGQLSRNASGQLLTVRLRRFAVLGELDVSRRLAELAGLDRKMTEGMRASAYLEMIRGAS